VIGRGRSARRPTGLVSPFRLELNSPSPEDRPVDPQLARNAGCRLLAVHELPHRFLVSGADAVAGTPGRAFCLFLPALTEC
jgi:hypothetical protein